MSLPWPSLLPPWLLFAMAGALGGSFLNVLIHRLPRMAERRMLRESGAPPSEWPGGSASYNLFLPGSHCPACDCPIPPYRNIPLLSWLLQRGRAACCGTSIPLRYWLVEVLSLCLALGAWWCYDSTFTGALAFFALALLLALGAMALEGQRIPRDLLYFFLWGGLLVNSGGLFASAEQATWAAALLALLALPGGHSDEREECILLAAAIGAWLGWLWLAVLALIVFPILLGGHLLHRPGWSPLAIMAAAGIFLFLVRGGAPYFAR